MPTPSTTSLKLDRETKERVQRLAAARRRSPHWVMREAIEQYLEPLPDDRPARYRPRSRRLAGQARSGQGRRSPKMPRLKWSHAALLDVARVHAFLVPKSRNAAQRAVKAIRQGVKALGKHPEVGRPVDELPPEFREWVIEFGSGAYVALYHYDGKQIVILAVRHGREAGY